MDFQNRVGSRTGGGGMASESESNLQRRLRLQKLASEFVELKKDPYFMKNHLGSYECRLCLTLHTSEGSYLAHTQGKKHQTNLARRKARDTKYNDEHVPLPNATTERPRRSTVYRIGRPGFQVTKVRDYSRNQLGLLFEIDYPNITENEVPRHRFMSTYEQQVEPQDKNYQFLVFAAEPYTNIAFKLPAREVDRQSERYFTNFNPETKRYTMQFMYRNALQPHGAGHLGPFVGGPSVPMPIPRPDAGSLGEGASSVPAGGDDAPARPATGGSSNEGDTEAKPAPAASAPGPGAGDAPPPIRMPPPPGGMVHGGGHHMPGMPGFPPPHPGMPGFPPPHHPGMAAAPPHPGMAPFHPQGPPPHGNMAPYYRPGPPYGGMPPPPPPHN
ncbi:hypothetical protein H696_01549 [Fonticula alba]|uniref:Matrin-type domain-containing protein n=1 Tax=Fonticula alba TaxID=691883 RepID=A0A058ZCK6_FONAL|nr:hypothetical protein H696_01549 [Fonticula alba]KCV72145.1 hypothetical protein H696_01549 [Fonticula alba]|eukprot:XP_009493723.1 hypothetical protein H696_01549 [Fonticula alba]